ncbi:MAG: hypothetical protein HS117_01740 [Verrucomicrobiaceae bacterium]|jgi:hypothetical protein|nr:hypothetical protein [Verrucomicrobiaceae bacterium]
MLPKLGVVLAIWINCAWSQEEKFSPPPAGINGWPDKPYDKVVGYQFANPEKGSFIVNGSLDLDKLPDLKRKESVLTEKQVTELLEATFATGSNRSGALCYDPHHIIVFYSKSNPVGAIEICFQCSGVRSWPENKATWWHTNFGDLGKITTSLGLGTDPPSEQKPAPISPKPSPTLPPAPPFR